MSFPGDALDVVAAARARFRCDENRDQHDDDDADKHAWCEYDVRKAFAVTSSTQVYHKNERISCP